MFQADSYLEKSEVKEFGVGYGIFSHTNETVWKVGRWFSWEWKDGNILPNITRWLGDPTNDCVTIIDTPGLQDTNNRTCLYTREIQEAVKQLGDIDAFFLLFKGDTTRLTPVLREQLNIFQAGQRSFSYTHGFRFRSGISGDVWKTFLEENNYRDHLLAAWQEIKAKKKKDQEERRVR